jgi:ABC-type Fe3+-hydroxamate transport system substrate-binding protein
VRIVSLIPEATEILSALGLAADTLAMTPEDAWRAGILRDRATTLIFTSETAAGGGTPRHVVRWAVSRLCPKPRPAVYALEPASVGEILSDIKTVGDAVGRQAAARSLIEALRVRIDAVSLRAARAIVEDGPRRVVCVSDDDPPVAAGTWLAELIGLAGGLDALDGVGRPSRAVTREQIQAVRPDLLLPVHAPTPGPSVVDLLERLAASIVQAPLHPDRSHRRSGASAGDVVCS